MTICIIPARGGSKGIPLKNLRVINGKSLLQRAIEKCQAAGFRAVVSSDHEETLRIAKSCGAIPLKRPDYLATDEAGAPATMRHARDELGIRERILQVQCNAPLMTRGDLERCALPGPHDLALCMHRFHGFVMDAGGYCVTHPRLRDVHQVSGQIPRRQDMELQWVISGSVWSYEPEYLDRPFYSGRLQYIESEHPIRLDIDEPQDLEIAKRLVDWEWEPAYVPQ